MHSKNDQRIYNKTKKFLEKRNIPNKEEKLKIIDSVLAIQDKEKRFSYLYDLIFDYLDNEFIARNICDFNCGICKRRQYMIDKGIIKENYLNGCCYSYKENKTCKYLGKDGKCQIKNIACKLFTCYYLRKKGYIYRINDIYLARYFFNIRQKFYIQYTHFVPKEEIIKGIMKRG